MFCLGQKYKWCKFYLLLSSSPLQMSLRSLETTWKTALASILAELTNDEFKKLLLNHLNKIPRGTKEDKSREEVPYLIVQYYGTEGSITEINKIMKQIPRMDADIQELLRPFVEKLEKLKKQVQKNKSEFIPLGLTLNHSQCYKDFHFQSATHQKWFGFFQ